MSEAIIHLLRRGRGASLLVLAMALLPSWASAQARADDTATPEAIVAATYESIAREPGGPFDWDRFRSLFLPEARLIPNTEQRQGEFTVLTPDDFVDWLAGATVIGGENDRGFAEEGVHNVVEQYGDVAHVFSTYQKHYWGETEILGRGINSFQLVRRDDRWWIVGIVWDEDYAAGPIPERYGGR
jgi:hypothetical protein